jgi:tetratricopeptide (TPR) repeat protein
MLFGRHSLVLTLVFISVASLSLSAQTSRPPLKDRELVALVAGNALSENVVHEIKTRGLAFRPSDSYQTLLTTAGADDAEMAALKAANIDSSATTAAPQSSDPDPLLQDLANAGKLVRAQQYDEAAKDLRDARDLQFNGAAESSFVAGWLLTQKKDYSEAPIMYSNVLQSDPNFPEAHTKLSYALYRTGADEDALREARAALTQNPNDAEAHKNAGLALQELRKFEASEQEYKEALRLKPDYESAHMDFGILLDNEGKLDESIAEYKKAIALNPNDTDAHVNLGVAYDDKGDFDSAIREGREAKRLNPNDFNARQNLASALMEKNMYAEAVVELREMETMWPNSPVCHTCLGTALFDTWNFQGAQDEFNKALALDPTNPHAHWGLGAVQEQNNNYDAALDEYRKAERLDDSYLSPALGEGRVLLAKNDVKGALIALKHAEEIGPTNADSHDFYGQALQSSGQLTAAIAQFREAVALAPKQSATRLHLAAALEKNKSWTEALDQYRQAAASDPSPGVKEQYKAAQDRLSKLEASMSASGNAKAAADLKTSVRATQVEPGISEKLDEALQSGVQAMSTGRIDQAEKSYHEAFDLAQKLQPHDDRLTTTYMALANIYGTKNDFGKVEENLEQALKTAQELHGAESPMITTQLEALGGFAAVRGDYDAAQQFDQRAIDIDVKTFGEASDKVADALRINSTIYVHQKNYEKAEELLLRAVRIDDVYLTAGGASPLDWSPLWSLCQLYDAWGKPDKAAPAYKRMLDFGEAKFGAQSPALLTTMAGYAKALRALSRTDEAQKLEQRMQAIQAGGSGPN